MRHIQDVFKLIIFAVMFCSILYLSGMCLAQTKYTVIRVIDGDTLFVEDAGGIRYKIRLGVIDCPEKKQPWGSVAKKYMEAQLLNKKVVLKNIQKIPDRYNRPIVIVFYKGENMNLKLIAKGLAEVYTGKQPKGVNLKPYYKEQMKARAKLMCMWGEEKYISPSDWRKGKR